MPLRSQLLGTGFSLLLRHRTEIYLWQAEGCDRCNPLNGPVIVSRKGGAQHFVTSEYLANALLQGSHIETTAQVYGKRYIVGRTARLQLVENPQAFLCKGKWNRNCLIRWGILETEGKARSSCLTSISSNASLFSER